MDNLRDSIANVSLYDVKAYVRKAQNAVLNFSDTEAKVREATNNEPWGASTSLMQEIADATNNYQQFHEIMPFIYRRFTEKSASEWRQIYKALQLLEYLVKNGSERVVDYARSHTAVIDMLGHFHYVDKTGRDQGVNIRNRSQELLALLSDVDKIRAERKQARALNNKTGVGSLSSAGGDRGGFGGTGKKYGGFGSSSIQFGGGGYSQQVYGDGGGFNGSNYSSDERYTSSQDDGFEEYDAGVAANSSASASKPASSSAGPVDDMIDFGKPAVPSKEAGDDDDDDFADFQSAPSTAPPSQTTSNNILDLFSTAPSTTTGPTTAAAPMASSTSPMATSSFSTAPLRSPPMSSTSKPKQDDIFGSLWSSSKSSPRPTPSPANPTPASSTHAPAAAAPASTVSNNDDLLTF